MQLQRYYYLLTVLLFRVSAAVVLLLTNLPPCFSEVHPAQIEQLIERLGSDSFSEREQAMEALRKIGGKVLPALYLAQKSEDSEIRSRATILIRQIDRSVGALRHLGAKVLFYGNQKPRPSTVNSVYMDDAIFEDGDLISLRECTNLRVLSLIGSSITNNGMPHLKSLSSLEGLLLGATSVTTLESLRDLTNLSSLDLSGSKINDDGLSPVKHFPNIYSLNLSGTQITDAGLASLTHLKNLKILALSKTKITDKGLIHLKDIKELEYLRLNGTQITDAGLLHLKKLRKLQRLYLSRTKTTAKGIDDLKKSLPDWRNYRSSASLSK